ncbi:type IA DNA topoisomerase [Metallosphaera tengchongensis]|uniref:type IA DNA topoisomerase n=1 Tax=Metallosphaera tengchongensis TaxID=1532350 RepID=UPI001FE9BA23|nr:type IA DNA topoisomerase [Metallosphaera tengchongensis]
MVITEKPSVALDIARALGKVERKQGYLIAGGYYITWTYGHILEIGEIAPKRWDLKDLPIFPEKFTYDVVSGKQTQLSIIKKLLERAEVVVNCGDAGREGELIVREVLEYLNYGGKVLRLWTSEALTREVVLREFRELKPSNLFDSLYYSALARQNGDWIVGINLTRLITLKAGGGEVWSVGRVQTPTLSMIVKRDMEIESFKPTTYYVILGSFSGMEGTLIRDGTEARLTKEEADLTLSKLKMEKEGVVKKVEIERKEERPPLLHSLTSLQREANVLYGFSAKKTLDLAQSLYEEWKLISYPRTDARYLGESNKGLAKDVLRKLGREDLIPKVDKVGKRVFDSSKLTDHHAIIPLDKAPTNLPQPEKKIYDLVLRKFIGAFMDNYLYDTQKVFIGLGSEVFLCQGKKNLQLGWMELYPHQDSPLTHLKEGERLIKDWVKSEERKTKPPPRFTESILLKEMERLGLGTPATRAGIIETLLERSYVERRGKSLISTEKGRELISKLGDSKVTSPEMTSEWERELEDIYVGKKGEEGYRSFIEKIKEFTAEEVRRLSKVELNVEPRAPPDMIRLARVVSKDLGVKLESTSMDYVRNFLDKYLPQTKILCKCGGEVYGFSKGWKCKSCGTVVWRQILGKRISFNQARGLFQGKELKMSGFRSKSGRRFSAIVYLDEGSVKFKFEE